MDQVSEGPCGPTPRAAAPARARLSLVRGGLNLAGHGAPEGWREAMADLTDWLGVPVNGASALAPAFMPWRAWCPTAFQNGGTKGLPEALFVASYAIEHPRALADPRRGGVDLMLLSPHPRGVRADGLPDPKTMQAMRAAAAAEGRERIAVLVPARHRAAIAAGKDEDIAILTPEAAVGPILADPARWDAIIVMPEQRSMILALLAEVTGVPSPWPMLWHGREGLTAITAEAPGAGEDPLALDATLLTHALTLALREAGLGAAAMRLHGAWAQLRASGVMSAARGNAAPYATEVPEGEFIALLCCGTTASRYTITLGWRALENKLKLEPGNSTPTLRIVSANLASF